MGNIICTNVIGCLIKSSHNKCKTYSVITYSIGYIILQRKLIPRAQEK